MRKRDMHTGYVGVIRRCGHPEQVQNAQRFIERAAKYDCRACILKERAEVEAREGHTHTCSSCCDSTPLFEHCHCDNKDVFLICAHCRKRDSITRARLIP